MMKIAQIVSTFPPYHGGIGNVAYCLSDHLSRLKYEVTVFTPMKKWSDFDYKSFFKIHHLVPQVFYGNAAVVFQLLYRCFNYDIIHFHYPFLGACLPIYFLKKIRGKKVKLIFHYHMDLVGQGWRKFIFQIYNIFFLRCLVSIADQVIYTSVDYLKSSIIMPYFEKSPQKFVEIPNGVDIEYFSPQPKSPRLVKRYSLEGKKVVLFVGGLDSSHYFKGINILLKAVQLIGRSDFKLIIVGDGDLRPVYQDLAEDFGLSDQVIFTGYIVDEELVKYYNLCDVFVLPSIDKSEAFGMVLLEAMSCAKPVIASDLPGVRQVVDKKVNGRLFKPKDIENLAEQLKKLLDNEAEGKSYGLAGRKKVEANYSWDIVVQQVIKLYEQT